MDKRAPAAMDTEQVRMTVRTAFQWQMMATGFLFIAISTTKDINIGLVLALLISGGSALNLRRISRIGTASPAGSA